MSNFKRIFGSNINYLKINIKQFFHNKNLLNSYFGYSNIQKTSIILSSALVLGYSSSTLIYPNVTANNFSSRVYSWGWNQYGQLGIGSEQNANAPTIIPGLTSNIARISCGSEQSAVVTNDGKVYTFGRGDSNRLGHGETGGLNETSPKLIEELRDKVIKDIHAGYMHMGCVTQDGELWTWGKNIYNQLGHDQSGKYPNPVSKLSEDGVIVEKVKCGRFHTVILDSEGNVYSWGGWKSGETGTGNKRGISEPTSVQFPNNVKIMDLDCGQVHTLFLDVNGVLYSCGAGDHGQTGHGAHKMKYHTIPTKIIGLPNNICKISCGQFHSICCNEDGDIYVFGENKDGQLGLGDTQNRTTPNKIDLSSFMKDEKNVQNWKCIDVAAGGGHSAILLKNIKTNEKKLYVFGRGRQGQIGRENKIESVAAYRSLPCEVDSIDQNCDIIQIDLGYNHSVALCQC